MARFIQAGDEWDGGIVRHAEFKSDVVRVGDIIEAGARYFDFAAYHSFHRIWHGTD